MRRRAFLTTVALLAPGAQAVDYPRVTPGQALRFPRDHGAHPSFRTEWWYVTGWLRDDAAIEYGFQVTFFRRRSGIGEDSPSAFAPRQLLFAHAGLADARHGRLVHDQRVARAGFELVAAREGNTDVWIDDWSLTLADDAYRARIAARGFALDLAFVPTQPILLQGEDGYSRKGPDPGAASYYYSRPHLAVTGSIEHTGERVAVHGSAWLDHEWATDYLAPAVQGWDWLGLNLDDGGALMAMRLRRRAGGVYWACGTLRGADRRARTLAPGEIRFEPLQHWRSPRTNVDYPVAMRIQAADHELVLEPLMADQELDSRASTGTIYWEGAVRALRAGRQVGRGYLELTGYWKTLQL